MGRWEDKFEKLRRAKRDGELGRKDEGNTVERKRKKRKSKGNKTKNKKGRREEGLREKGRREEKYEVL